MTPLAVKEVCSIQEIGGEPLFRGEFEIGQQLYRFAGRMTVVAEKVIAFQEQLRSHPEWRTAEVSQALVSAGAKYGPDKKKEFVKALPFKALQQIFGPMSIKYISSVEPGAGWGTYWKVRTIMKNNPRAGLVMSFEPFEGQLQLLYATGPVRTWDPVAKKFRWEMPKE